MQVLFGKARGQVWVSLNNNGWALSLKPVLSLIQPQLAAKFPQTLWTPF
jgi:hypothetical protein